MKKYLSIGKVAKIKNISIKSLRYYDQIGILKPAHTDPNTGYRYYTEEQLLFVDIIQFFISLDIPLKSYTDYMTDQKTFNLEQLLLDGRSLMNQKIEQMHFNLRQIEMALPVLETMDGHIKDNETYIRHISDRHLMILPIKIFSDASAFQERVTGLRDIARVWKVVPNLPTGLIMDYTPNVTMFYVYLEIDRPLPECPNYKYIPETTYQCKIENPQTIYTMSNLPEAVPGIKNALLNYFEKNVEYPKPITIFESDFVQKIMHLDQPMVELMIPDIL